MPKPADHKKITIVAFLTAILGFFSIWPGGNDHWYTVVLRDIGNSVYLVWLRNEYLHVFDMNGMVLAAYILLLIGAILYVTSQYRESRLIRFVFSLIIISKTYFILVYLVSLLGRIPDIVRTNGVMWGIIYMLIDAGWFLLSWWILKQFKEEKAPDVEHVEYGDTTMEVLIPDSLWQRLFHLVVDTLLCMLIFSVNIYMLASIESLRLHLNQIASILGERLTLAILLGLYRLVYYIFFESLFGATPAKLLTESRVLTRDGEKPGFGTITGRTFSRFIPFEAFSFFSASGWHDRFSNTVVVREKRTGVRGASYFFLLPVLLSLYLLGNFGAEQYEHYTFKKKEQKNADALVEKLSSVDTNSVFQLIRISKDPYMNSSDVEVYLKVDKVSPASITFSKIVSVNSYDDVSQRSIEDQYNDSKATLQHYTYSKTSLEQAVKSGQIGSSDTVGIKIGDIQYGIRKIESYFMPNIKLQYAQNYGGPEDVRIYLSNTGWPADVNEIRVLEGDVKVTNSLPMHLKQIRYNGSGLPFIISGTRKSGQDFKLSFSLTDTLNRVQLYELASTGNEVELKRIK
ncbi:MAG: RDD family protein [Bacteroidetes bacterium]|nr:RDD family protein [Bacteroidota bacterium]